MAAPSFAYKFVRLALVPVLAVAVGTGTALSQQGHDNQGHDNNHNQNHGNPPSRQGDNGSNFHFRDQDRGQLQSHYKSDINRWRGNPKGRPQFSRGQRIPNNYRFQPVPSSYYRGMPPPPSGYQYGYYDGYVVAYNPTSRIIGDVLDLVAAASR